MAGWTGYTGQAVVQACQTQLVAYDTVMASSSYQRFAHFMKQGQVSVTVRVRASVQVPIPNSIGTSHMYKMAISDYKLLCSNTGYIFGYTCRKYNF